MRNEVGQFRVRPDPRRRDVNRGPRSLGLTRPWSTATVKRITAFLMDDHEVVRQGVRALLESSGDIVVVGEAANAAEAIARIPACGRTSPILDVRVPDGNGIEVCREVRSRVGTNCLMLTSYSDDEALFEAIMAGAAGTC